ncbi:MAG: glutamyl-tRNA reductase, partial [Pseudonocardiaceae bacterium]
MKLLAVGLNFRSASEGLLTSAVRGTSESNEVLADLLLSSEVAEAMIVSTCNRVEVYAAVNSFHGALSDIGTVLARRCRAPLTELAHALYAHYADGAARHLFTVASGLDSVVQGEHQILGQLRAAYTGAVAAGTAGSLLHEVMQHALRLGKRVHTEIASVNPDPSMADAALRLGTPHLGTLAGTTAVVVGAGQMGELAAAALRNHGVARLRILSRNAERAAHLAGLYRADSGGMEQLASAVAEADLVLCATTSPQVVLGVELVASRTSGKLLVVDLAMPADVDPAVSTVPGVHLV